WPLLARSWAAIADPTWSALKIRIAVTPKRDLTPTGRDRSASAGAASQRACHAVGSCRTTLCFRRGDPGVLLTDQTRRGSVGCRRVLLGAGLDGVVALGRRLREGRGGERSGGPLPG